MCVQTLDGRLSSLRHCRSTLSSISLSSVNPNNSQLCLSYGIGCGFQKAKIDFGDVFISSILTAAKGIAKAYSEFHMEEDTVEIDDLLHSIFCSKSTNISDCDVTEDRTANYLVDNVISGVH